MSDKIEISVEYRYQTAKAILVTETGDDADSVWVAKATIYNDPDYDAMRPGNVIEIEMLERTAIEKGFI